MHSTRSPQGTMMPRRLDSPARRLTSPVLTSHVAPGDTVVAGAADAPAIASRGTTSHALPHPRASHIRGWDGISDADRGEVAGASGPANVHETALEPKVQIPFQRTAGLPPRRVEIERRKRLYAAQDITELLAERGIVLERLEVERAREPRTLPLDAFDDSAYEEFEPHQWLQRGMHQGEQRGVPAKALGVDDLACAWRDCRVVSYDDAAAKYHVVYDSPADCADDWLSRVYIMFKSEDPFRFADRVAAAVEQRLRATEAIRFQLYVDCMPVDDLPQLDTEQMARILALAMSGTALKRLEKVAAEIMQEANLNYARTMNRILHDLHVGGSGVQVYPPLRLQPSVFAPEPPTTVSRRIVRPADIPPHRFEVRPHVRKLCALRITNARLTQEHFSDFSFNSLLTKQEVIEALVNTKLECDRLAKLSLLSTSPHKTLKIEEFDQLQTAHVKETAGYLKDNWTAAVKTHIQTAFKRVGKGWFSLQESDREVYQFSKLRKVFHIVNYMMQDALRYMMDRSLQDYTRYVCNGVRGPIRQPAETGAGSAAQSGAEATTSRDGGGAGGAGGAGGVGAQMMLVEMVVKGEGDKCTIAYESQLHSIVDAPLAKFDSALKDAVDIVQVERLVMDRLFWSHRPTVACVMVHEPHVRAMRQQLEQELSAAIKPLEELLQSFAKYAAFLRQSAADIVEELEAKYADDVLGIVEEVKQLTIKHMDAEHEVDREVPHNVVLGGIRVSAAAVKRALVEHHRKLWVTLLDLLADKTAEAARRVCDEFRQLDRNLSRAPENIEDLSELKQYMKEVPRTVKELQQLSDMVQSNFEVLDGFKFRLKPSHFMLRWTMYGWPKTLHDRMLSVERAMEVAKREYYEEMEDQKVLFDQRLVELDSEVLGLHRFNDVSRVEMVAKHVRAVRTKIERAEQDAKLFNSREGLFGAPVTDYELLRKTQRDFEPFSLLWETADDWEKWHAAWTEAPFPKLDAEAIERNTTAALRNLTRVVKALERQQVPDVVAVARHVKEQVEGFKPYVPLITALRTPGMQDRHWAQISQHTGFELRISDKFTLQDVFSLKLLKHQDEIVRVGETAGKEFQIRKSLDKMYRDWEGVQLDVASYRATGTYVLRGIDELMALLDEHVTMTQAMQFSAFKKYFEAEIDGWNKQLALVSEVLDEWGALQRSWLYLQPIFDSPDINKQLPAEGKRFGAVDKNWRHTLQQAKNNPAAIRFCAQERLLERFRQSNRDLDAVQKGLSDYLETKRSAFARFYFLSNDELLEILSQTKDPTRVQPHLKKCFEAIKSVDFEKDMTITSMRSSEGEHVAFHQPITTAEKNVEMWMNEVERRMCRSVRRVLYASILDYVALERTEWIQKWPGQCVLNGSQVHWTREVEEALRAAGNEGARKCYRQQVAQLEDMVRLVRGSLPKLARVTIGALAVIDVHARDVTKKLVDDGVADVGAFEWISQLRYYWEGGSVLPDGEGGAGAAAVMSPDGDAQGDLWAMMVTSKRPYGYEYLGNSLRLVITPLTDKCYLTLMGALQMVLGGAPAGPAGTGKTETTKDLAKALAKQCVVFNCSDGMDYKMTGKFFKGLASCGAWACFDEFNRIVVEVLSVIAQQIMTLQKGVIEGRKRVQFEETEIALSDQFAVFITMNPGYAGRTELPDNLKALFRPVAMMVPDYALIGEIMLFSYGFSAARNCARKMVATFRLCSEQLSSQDHYDYGMRAVKTVIVAAGNLKRAEPDADEETLLLRALMDVNLPKFLAHDLPLFQGIMSDLFPGKSKPAIDYGPLVHCMKLCAERRRLQPVPQFLEKCVQLYEMIVVRHGLMVVGPTGGGKTSNIRVLRDALTMLKERGVQGERYEAVRVLYLNPKAITMGQLYGEFDPTTHEWQDGVLANLIRQCTVDATPDLKWVLLDGPVDTLWIESMNTVLDDNKKLCLNSGEIIALTDEMTMMFEPEDLAVASPATVSRCGMVYMEPSALGTDPVLRSWLEKLPAAVQPQHKSRLVALCDCFVRGCLELLRRHLREPVPSVDNNLLASLFRILDTFFDRLLPREGRPGIPKDEADAMLQHIDSLFLFALVWSVCATVDRDGRRRLSAHLREAVAQHGMPNPFPEGGLVYDYAFDATAGAWVPWTSMATEFHFRSGADFSEMIVPTMDTVRYTYLLERLLMTGKHVLMTGPTGTGKTVNIASFLRSGLPETHVPLMFTFSAQTSANQTQDIVDGKTEKRKKGVYGPPMGKTFVLFVDDVNMPQREKFFAQPPVELLRQWLCAGGWYDRKALAWRRVVDTVMVLACGPPGGGRNPVTARFFRHFNMINYSEMQDESMHTIFNSILAGFLTAFPEEVQRVGPLTVWCTIELFNMIAAELLPTPTRSHYTFNLRDLGKVFQGLLMGDSRKVAAPADFVRMWVHETRRVFRDRLVDADDRGWFDRATHSMIKLRFKLEVEEVMPNELLFYGDYMDPGADPRVYEEVSDPSRMKPVFEEYLAEFNADTKTPMDLVLFTDAIEHVSRISRVLRQPLGHALLLGVGGSGRQSLTKLAASMAHYRLFQVEIAKGYGVSEWREDVKGCLLGAGLKNQPVVFLFNDTQIVFEGMLEDINNLLNAGDIPNLYGPEEEEDITSACKIECAKRHIPPTKANVMNQFVQRVRRNLHVVLCMSPMGEAFRRRLRMFPSLVNCCTIDWFSEWPDEALRSVAMDAMTRPPDLALAAHMEGAVEFFRVAHQSVAHASERFRLELRRNNHVTPTSYLELLSTYRSVLTEKREHVGGLKSRLQAGLDKVKSAQTQVASLQQQIKEMQPKLEATQKEVDEMIVRIEADKTAAAETKMVVEKEEREANQQAAEMQTIADDAQADLNAALPALDEAVDCLKNLRKADLDEVRSMGRPPNGVRLTMEATCIMFKIKPVRKNDPDRMGQKVMDYWEAAQKSLLNNPAKLMKDLLEFDKDNIPEGTIVKIEKFMHMPEFMPKEIEKASKACTAICMWVRAMYTYHQVAKDVEPKRQKLAEAQATLDVTMAALDEAKTKLKGVEDRIAELEANFERSQRKKQALVEEEELCRGRLERAKTLLGGLGGEQDRWERTVRELTTDYANLVGDALIAASSIAYLGPFTPEYRSKLAETWRLALVRVNLPHTVNCTMVALLADPVQVRAWTISGLPSDSHSVENGIIMAKARRWPLLIDPQGQANRFIKNMGKDAENGLEVLKMTDKNFLRDLETCVRFGRWALLESVGEALDAALEPLLLQQKFRQGGTEMIKLGDSVIPYNDSFRFFMTTKLPNPQYAPEVCVKVSLLNFTITPRGLEDQLLGMVITHEMPELEEKKNSLVVSNAQMRKELKHIEDTILRMLSASKGNILDDIELIQVLASSKQTSEEINRKVLESEVTECEIDASREQYRPVAERGSLLYFCIAQLGTIEPMYQYSLQWFTNLFTSSIGEVDRRSDFAQRIAELQEHFAWVLYTNVCRSLFEKDKLLLSFLMCIAVLQGQGQVDGAEWRFLISGQAPAPQQLANPAPTWITDRMWTELLALGGLPAFEGLVHHVAAHLPDWQAVFDHAEPQDQALPGPWQGALSSFQRICVLRALRPDKVLNAVLAFVVQHLGRPFVEPPPFDLATSFQSSSPVQPLIFVLSTGSDPTKLFYEFAKKARMQNKVKALSLGQGQDRIAAAMIEEGVQRGGWVYLQNCHLYTSWMPRLEEICEGITLEAAHKDFRLWLTSKPSEDFPAALLQNGVKITMEPPKGLRSNLRNAYFKLDNAQLNATSKPLEFKKLLFALSFFHALVQERRKFGPLGWNIPYEFNDSDLEISRRQLELFLDAYEEVPYKVLNFLTSYINYGGRVTDYIDLRTIDVILRELFCEDILRDGYPFSASGVYVSPAVHGDDPHRSYMAYIDGLPLNADPEVFGMHPNANIICAQNETYDMLNTVLSLQTRETAAGARSYEEEVDEIARGIAEQVPGMFDLEGVAMKYPLRYDESMNTVLLQECQRYNALLAQMKRSLPELRKALKGLVVMSAELEAMANSLYTQHVPASWEARAYPSLKPLNSWVMELVDRLRFLQGWVDDGTPAVFWISGFFFPQAFLTGTLQNYARKVQIPIDTVSFGFHFLRDAWQELKEPPTDGVCIRGLYLEGARWDEGQHSLSESLPKQLYTELPVVHLQPVKDRATVTSGVYRCPVYKILSRRGTLSTTGHSTNFIMWIEVPSNRRDILNNTGQSDQDAWIKAGVAAFCSLRF